MCKAIPCLFCKACMLLHMTYGTCITLLKALSYIYTVALHVATKWNVHQLDIFALKL